MNLKYPTFVSGIFLFFVLSCRLNAQQWNGLSLLSIINGTASTLVDTNGVTVHTWTYTGGNGYSAYMAPGGSIYRTINETPNVNPSVPGMTGGIQKLDYNGNILWQYSFNSPTGILHHDFAVMPNGNILATAYDVKYPPAIANAGSTCTETIMYSERILELKPVGTNSAIIVWEWKMWDHLIQNVSPSSANYQTSIVNHPELFDINYLNQSDICHMNGIDYNPILDEIVFSSRYRSEWYVIDHSTTMALAASHAGGNSGKGGDILYRWGNPPVYQAAAPAICNVTHDPHWVPEGVPNTGNLVGFNNGGQVVPSLKSTIDRISPPRVGYNYTINIGSAFTPTTYASRYVCTAYNLVTGNSEQFPNGNQAICLGTSGVVYEIDPGGNILWSYNIGGINPQVHRYTPCYVNNAGPPQPSISVSGSSLVCTSAVTYQWYYNGSAIPSGTNQTLPCIFGQNGNYIVRITDINGCAYFYSQSVFFTPPSPTGIINLNAAEEKIQIYPNPNNGTFKINIDSEIDGELELVVMNVLGQKILQQKITKGLNDVNTPGLGVGIYNCIILKDKKNLFSAKLAIE